MKNFWPKAAATLISSNYRPKAINWPLWLSLLALMGLMAMAGGCNRRLPAEADSSAAPEALAVSEAMSTAAEAASVLSELPTPTPDRSRITSPELASELAIPSPTPRPTATPLAAGKLVSRWPQPQPLAAGRTVAGRLDSGDGAMQDGTYIDLYEFAGQPGQFVTLTLTSTALDAVLLLLNDRDEVVAHNDDFDPKAGSNARLALTLPAAGAYRAVVNSYEAGEGTYNLRLELADRRQEGGTLVIGEPAQGWLLPGDAVNQAGLYADRWSLTMGEEPLVVWARSSEFDPRLDAFDADGNLLVKNGDLDRIGRDFDARILLAPSPPAPPGSQVTLEVALQGEFAVGGAYELLTLPLPGDSAATGTVQVRPIIVHNAAGPGNSQATPQQVRAAVEQANQVWQACGLQVVMEREPQIEVIAGLEGTVDVEDISGWTAEEDILMAHPSHALATEGVITAYFVPDIDDGGRYGIAYPATRYAAGRSGLLIVADSGVTQEAYLGTLAHEIGHILGLNHPDLDDGDPDNDTVANLMFTTEGLEDLTLERVYGELTPLQCLVARAAPHFVHATDSNPLTPPAFRRSDRVLLPGDEVAGALTTRDAVTTEAEEQFLDVFYFHGQAGDQVTVELTATAFDPFLLLEGPDGQRVAQDDDGGQGWNARIDLTLPASGDYSVGVTSFSRAVGGYRLSLASQ